MHVYQIYVMQCYGILSIGVHDVFHLLLAYEYFYQTDLY